MPGGSDLASPEPPLADANDRRCEPGRVRDQIEATYAQLAELCGNRVIVVRAGDKFELLHTNKLADDDMCMATPGLAGDRLLIRTAARLYCLKTAIAR